MKITNTTSGREIAFVTDGFAGGERHFQLQGITPAKIDEISIRAELENASDVFDLLLAENALRHKFGRHLKLNLELPYLPYARQDRVCAPGQAFSLEVFANVLKLLRINKLVTWDCHSNVGLDITGAVNVSAADIIIQDPALKELLSQDNTILVCPDKGALARCEEVKKKLGTKEIVLCEKKRDPATGKIYKTEVNAQDLSGREAVITDDICDGGFTFLKVAEQLKALNVKRITLYVTHGIFSKGLDVFDGLIDEVITTNSRSQTPHPKLRIINFDSTLS